MRLLWIVLALTLIGGIYLYQNPAHSPQTEALTTGAGHNGKTTQIYKWQNDRGEWQVSNKLPPEGTMYDTLSYREDVNVLPLPPQLGDKP